MVQHISLPTSASLDDIREILSRTAMAQPRADGRTVFPGISLSAAVVEGQARKADDLVALLQEMKEKLLGPDAILVVPTLEPSWAVVFPRFAGVVAELGGELSHASILLREARCPAIVNCSGVFQRVNTGDRIRVDGSRGVVELLASLNRGDKTR
jgi:phosphohistidine swiveling domain-containing protein